MILKQIPSGYDRNFSYLIIDEKTKEAAVIDPSVDTSLIKSNIKDLQVKYIINTHSHPDHIAGNEEIKSLSNAKIVQHELSPAKHDISVKDNQEIKIGSLILRIIYTPGHSKDHICILVKDKLFTGDLLFVGKIGGTGQFFPGSDAKEEFNSLQRIINLDEDIRVYPGHDYGIKPISTIKHEKETNPFLLCKTFEEFQNLKYSWLQYKKEHNID
jgi:glyoxylase-like metal-dependent hydrolase (beta-lactamase superfamily II)